MEAICKKEGARCCGGYTAEEDKVDGLMDKVDEVDDWHLIGSSRLREFRIPFIFELQRSARRRR